MCGENKGADQLCSYCTADLRLCFRICKLLVFSCTGSFVTDCPNPPPPHSPSPTPTGKLWDSQAIVQGNNFLLSPQCRGNDRALTLGSLPKSDFLLRRAGQRAKFLCPVCPLGRGL